MKANATLLVCALLAPTAVHAQVPAETIRGRVTSDSGAAIRGAIVSATMAPDRSVQQTTTDDTGRFIIQFQRGTGDYLIHVSAVGFRTFRKRLTHAPGDTALMINVKLTSEVTELPIVRVQAKMVRPRPGDEPGRDVGSAAQQREGVFASLSPDQEGNLVAIANAIPGATAQAGGISVLGLAGDQSTMTLNGLAFAGAQLPRDAQMQVRVATSPYDPSRGGFSGAQTSVELSPGRNFYRRQAHVILDAPALQATSSVGDRLGQRFTSVNGSIGGSGESVENVWYYNTALQVSRRTSDAASLLTVGDGALSIAGIAPDSAARFRQILGTEGIPFSSAHVPRTAISQTASFVTRIDHAPYRPGTYDPSPSTWNTTFFGNVADDEARSFSPTSTPTHGGRQTTVSVGGQLDYSRYFGDVLNDTRSALSLNDDHGMPYLRSPSGTVLVSSTLPGGDAALAELAFGGDGTLDYARRSWTWEAINETQWYSNGGPHRLKLTAEARRDAYSLSAPENQLGTFVFPSLASLALGQPSSFSRTLSAPERTGGESSGFVALGDYWRATPSLQLLFGARLEGNRYTTMLADNPAVAAAFGATTTHAPNTISASPRLGFTWYFGQEPQGNPIRFNAFASQTLQSNMLLRGGIGEFRGLLAPTLLSEASVANGLPGGAARLSCIGSATPMPQWADYLSDSGTIPTTCATGAPSSFADAAPSIRLFDRSYDAPRSWRANLNFLRTIGQFAVSLDGVYSLNLNQPGTIDLNFAGVPKFNLPDEGERVVFVAPSSIVPASGTLSPVDSRVSSSFGRVISAQSDLHSTSRQVTATITPKEFANFYYSLAYTLADIRANANGFDATTFDSPSRVERAPGDFDVRHQVQAGIGGALPHGMSVALFARFMSGLPYTPRVAGDINGDGLANDRAFIFDPAHSADAGLAMGMRSLLASAPTQARDCLVEQIGLPAARNSCRGPWTAYLNARIGLVNRFSFTERSFKATLNITNPLGGLDQLLHGAGRLQGWGGGTLPDATLLNVRGFDPTVNRFLYEVNPRFGNTGSAGQLAKIPFRVTLDVNFDLGVSIVKQQALKLLNPGRAGHSGQRLTADSMTALLRWQVPDIYTAIIRESDSLPISREQVEALKAADIPYRARVDSVWKASTSMLAAMGADYDSDAAMHLIDDTTERAWLLTRDELAVLSQILSPLQMRMAPWVPALQRTVGQKTVGIRVFAF
jgi:hypothetical protein